MNIRGRLKSGIDNAGLTLVEVIVSITILACISIPLMAYFSQSLQYSVVTAKQQKATALAQNLTEGIKSQQTLLMPVSSNTSLFTVPYMDKSGPYTVSAVSGTGLLPSGEPCFQVDGSGLPIGVVKYSQNFYENGSSVSSSSVSGNNVRKYSVDITLSTVSDLNTGDHPIIYGIDDVNDIIAIESEQISTAVMYFKSINAAYGTPGHYYSDPQLRLKMNRNIIADFDYDNTVGDEHYEVNVYYQFSCSGLRDGEPTTVDYITTTPLTYTKIVDPKNLYIMFNRLHPLLGNDHDRILINLSDNVPASFELPELFLIVQNLSDDNTQYNKTGYAIALGINKTNLDTVKIHTNTVTVNESGAVNYEYIPGEFRDITAFYDLAYASPDNTVSASTHIGSSKISEVTDKGPQLRTVNILTEVYDLKSDGTRGDKLATYSSSKGE